MLRAGGMRVGNKRGLFLRPQMICNVSMDDFYVSWIGQHDSVLVACTRKSVGTTSLGKEGTAEDLCQGQLLPIDGGHTQGLTNVVACSPTASRYYQLASSQAAVAPRVEGLQQPHG